MLCAGPRRSANRRNETDLYAERHKLPKGAKLKAVPSTPARSSSRRARSKRTRARSPTHRPNSYYVLNDDPVLTGDDIKNPQQSSTNRRQRAADVTFGFTSHGETVFERVTKEIAQRGQEAQLPGVTKEAPSSTSRSCSTAS